MKKLVTLSAAIACWVSFAHAHTALMNCIENADGQIGCEAGYSDGSSATGIMIKVIQDGKVVLETKLDQNSEASFKKPNGSYTVIFDGGDGHTLSIPSTSILQ